MEPDLSWCAVLEHHARRTPDQLLAREDDVEVTYAGMRDWSAAIAGGLAARGVTRHDVVAVLSYNRVEVLATIFAANHLGAAAMPINWRLAPAELRFILDHSGARALVADADLLELAAGGSAGLAGLTRVVVGADDPVAGWDPFVAVGSGPAVPRVPVAGDDLHRLMYTSGTTGRPKGVMLTHANLAWKNYAHVVELGITTADVGLACGPLHHVGALDLVTTSMMAVGAPTVVHRVFDAARVVDDIERHRITVVWAAPAMVRAILDVPGVEQRDLSAVRLLIAGGEKMPIPFIERLRTTFPECWFADAYGLTETVSGDTFLDRDHTITKLGSVGRPCPYLELDLWDEDGVPVPPGVAGEIVLRGPKVFAGYWRDPDATAAAFVGGWFHTGDVGVRDDDGFLFVVDRLKDLIISGGENIASSEVERVLYEHDAVLEVAVVGRPDEQWGEVPVAFVVLRPDADPAVDPEALIAHCRDQLAKFKVPKAVTFLDALPRNPSGKVLKRDLRRRAAPPH
jgi:acyl-CoA synthetase (AMP-forming)/AMP-acid ligase II